jgi:hypothetical protein
MDNEIEILIARAEALLCFMGVDDAIATLVDAGVATESAYLACVAASIG